MRYNRRMKDCNSCGKCSVKYSDGGLSATDQEVDFWDAFRPEIAPYINAGEIWMDPESGQQLKRCPWLSQDPVNNKYLCSIYNDRPEDCMHYPVTVTQMVEDECQMLEVRDLRNPDQAQRDLDKLMIDSRPPVLGNY